MKPTHKKALLFSLPAAKLCLVIILLGLAAAATPRPEAARPEPANTLCACCAEPGEWYESTRGMPPHEIEELRRVKFGPTASVYTNAAGFEVIKGLPAEHDSYDLRHSYGPGRAMTLALRGKGGESGSLVLSLPAAATQFGTDMHDMPEGSSGPILYKEWRFKGTVAGSGAFKKGIAPGTKFHLILQGRGNNCLSSEDFSHWRLEVTGPRASYAFYGALGAAR